jgi:hypothetical protein
MAASDGSIKILPSPDALAEGVASDVIGGLHHQLVKMEWGSNDSALQVDNVIDRRLPTQAARIVTTGFCSVAAGATVPTTGIDCRGYDPIAILVPAEFDGTVITFQGSTDNGTFVPLYDATNSPLTMTVTASRGYPLWGELSGWPYIKVICGTPQATTATVFSIVLQS